MPRTRKVLIHRDLKPQNIMVDKHGRVAVMDFGIARSIEMSGLTQTGVLIGTPKYMSPEQAKGEEIDSRSDLFSLGLIFYELLTGKSPYEATTSFGSLLKRTQEHARPPIELDHAIPKFMNDIVVRCLEIDPQRRYASAQEILRDLEARHGPPDRRQGSSHAAVPDVARVPDEMDRAGIGRDSAPDCRSPVPGKILRPAGQAEARGAGHLAGHSSFPQRLR